MNRLHLVHPLGTVRPLGPLFNRGPYPAGGDPFSVWPNATRIQPYYDDFHSASYRMIVDLADLSRSVSVCPVGQSGHPASPHYADQLQEWQAGRYHVMLWEHGAIASAAEGTLRLQPARWTTEAAQHENGWIARWLDGWMARWLGGTMQANKPSSHPAIYSQSSDQINQ